MNPYRLNGILRYAVAGALILLFSEGGAQTCIDSSLAGRPIARYEIIGNEKTKSFVLLREIKQQPGDYLDLERCEADRKRILSMHLFNRVMMTAVPVEDSVAIQIIVTEQWYIIPFPILHLVDRDWNKISYGLGLNHLNFRGRAETLSAIVKLGFNPHISCTYTNPWLDRDKNWDIALNVAYNRVRSKHFEELDEKVDENQSHARISLGRRFGFHTSLAMETGVNQVTLTPPVPGQTLSPDGRDRFVHAALYFGWDHRDFKDYPMSGWLCRLSLQQNGLFSSIIDYRHASADLRIYLPVKIGALALRSAWGISSGKIPVYSRTYLGYSERIRGHFFDTHDGENRTIASLAFRRLILEEQYFTMSPESELSDLRFGMGFGLFADTGLIWFRNDPVRAGDLISGYGGGLHFLLPYNTLLRLECAFNESGRVQWIADMDVDI
jgi:outer membrane protein assembly factor BamA